MNDRTLKLILKYNNSAIPDNHNVVFELMSCVDKPFEYDGKMYKLNVIPMPGVHNVQLYKFFMIEEHQIM